MLPSLVCRTNELETPEFRALALEMRETPQYHRKQWEFCYIAKVLQERGKLAPGMRGLGFAVGKEPLTGLFAKRGAAVLATDLDPTGGGAVVGGWTTTNQHAATAADLNERNICPAAEFDRLVKFAYVDMNHVPADLTNFDFVWSACAIEHVGGLHLAKAAMFDMMKCLKPGGVAVHTTEFNVCSDEETIETGYAVIWRKRDIEEIAIALRDHGHLLVPPDLKMGSQFADHYVDEPPYKRIPHMKLRIGEYVATSVGLIIIADGVRLAAESAPTVWSRLFGGRKRAA